MAQENLTGQKVSFTYGRLIQKIDSSYYDGFGNPVYISDVSSLQISLVNYINDVSLNHSQFIWNNGILDVSVIGGSGVSKAYVDGSLSLRDASITALFKYNVSQDASIVSLRIVNTSQDASTIRIDASLNDTIDALDLFYNKTYVDTSLNLKTSYTYVDTSLFVRLKDSSLNPSYFKWNGGLLEPSIAAGSGDVTKAYVDASLFVRIKDSSLSISMFKWNAGYLEPSVASGTGDVTKAYVDASLVNIRTNYVSNASLGVDSFYYDGSSYLQSYSAAGTGIVGKWKYKTGTGDSDPGNAAFKLNNADPSLATFVYINNKTTGGADVRNILLEFKQGNYFYVQKLPDSTEYCVYKLTNSAIGASGYVKLPVEATSTSGSTFTNNKEFGFIFFITPGATSGDVTKAYVDASLVNIRATYIPDVSLSGDFTWAAGKLYADVSVIAGGAPKAYVDGSLAKRDASINWLYDNKVDPSTDYTTYSPITSDVSFYYNGDLVSEILTTNFHGTKTVNFLYDINGDVSTILINNYNVWQKEVTFEKDINENILAVHIK